ncbi:MULTISPECIES: hypothetical protein [Rhodococcus]|uniref:hypothetical protein n=1 Tax=Rhodococcus TaxID=1827 RepID=UPI00193B578F|nr:MULTISPECIES: hypothetical protein [Rhodococcus]QRI74848.1 hypothetical protein JQ505_20055 [Rhodococcus aetherivorans]QSE58258.1 hypothetical protein JYA75_21160 [Rhodococcus sp. PSBB066]QSE70420.1 hypothetical protein JYA91_06470 [Rhodococcus sp. PSBB049]
MNAIHALTATRLRLASEMQDQLSKAGRYDPDYTVEANAKRAAERRAQIKAEFAARSAKIDADVAAAAQRIKTEAAAVRPRPDLNSPADLIRTEQAWRNAVLPHLEQGRSLREALAHADVDAVLGAERFASAYLRTKTGTASGLDSTHVRYDVDGRPLAVRAEIDLSHLELTITARLAELTPEHGEAIRLAGRVDHDVSAHREVSTKLERGDALSAAITAQLSQYDIYAAIDTDTDTAPSVSAGVDA